MKVHVETLTTATSIAVLGFGLLLVASRLQHTKMVRDLGLAALLLAVGCLVRGADPRANYSVTLAIAMFCWHLFAGWAWLAIRSHRERFTRSLWKLSFVGTAVAMCFGGLLLPSLAYQGVGLSYAIQAVAYAACVPLALRGNTENQRGAAYAIGACLMLATIQELAFSYAFFVHGDGAMNRLAGIQLTLAYFFTFWQLLLGALGVVVYNFTEIRDVIEFQSASDPLTMVLNRRGLDARIAALTLAATRPGVRPSLVGVIAVDIDNFKQINDKHGHGQGDAVLTACADRLRKALRGNDVIARTGGEEFIVLLANSDPELTQHVCERLRVVINESPIALNTTTTIAVTVSVGFDISEPTKTAIEKAITRADLALYAAKRSGKNCVRSATSLAA